MKIPILQFADDTLVFVNAGLSETLKVRDLLLLFEVTSGLRVHIMKTLVFIVNHANEGVVVLRAWGCCQGKFPTFYVGVPLGFKSRCVLVWELMLEKIRG